MTRKTTLALLAASAALVAGLAIVPAVAHDGGKGWDRGGMMDDMRPDFATLDADGDGKITDDEFTAHRRAMMTAIDTDGDGAISAEEMAAHLQAEMQAARAARMGKMLERMDADGDGKVTIEEMLAGPARKGPVARLDQNNDGAVSADEYADAGQRMSERGGMMHGQGRHDGRMGHGGHGRMGDHMPWWMFGGDENR